MTEFFPNWERNLLEKDTFAVSFITSSVNCNVLHVRHGSKQLA